jgi:hypothetical protein
MQTGHATPSLPLQALSPPAGESTTTTTNSDFSASTHNEEGGSSKRLWKTDGDGSDTTEANDDDQTHLNNDTSNQYQRNNANAADLNDDSDDYHHDYIDETRDDDDNGSIGDDYNNDGNDRLDDFDSKVFDMDLGNIVDISKCAHFDVAFLPAHHALFKKFIMVLTLIYARCTMLIPRFAQGPFNKDVMARDLSNMFLKADPFEGHVKAHLPEVQWVYFLSMHNEVKTIIAKLAMTHCKAYRDLSSQVSNCPTYHFWSPICGCLTSFP